MYKAYSYRIYPNNDQVILLAKHFGCVRFIYNYMLELKSSTWIKEKDILKENRTNLNGVSMCNLLPTLKNNEEYYWLKEIGSQSLQQSIMNLDVAMNKFFKGAGYPRFKSKHDKQIFNIPSSINIDYNASKLSIPKFINIKNFDNRLKIRIDRVLVGKIKSATIKKMPSGKYFVSILTDDGLEEPKLNKLESRSNILGVDLGLKDFLITSNGDKVESLKALKKSEVKLSHYQRLYSRKKKGSKNKEKARIKVARIHETIVNKRKDFQQKLSTELISKNQAVGLETLKVKNMIKNHCLAKAISDASWSSFISMLEYKAKRLGKPIIKIDSWFPSSKLCSECGWKNKELVLKDRTWVCKNCGVEHDRDINAAVNIQTQSWTIYEHSILTFTNGIETKNKNRVGLEETEFTPMESKTSKLVD